MNKLPSIRFLDELGGCEQNIICPECLGELIREHLGDFIIVDDPGGEVCDGCDQVSELTVRK